MSVIMVFLWLGAFTLFMLGRGGRWLAWFLRTFSLDKPRPGWFTHDVTGKKVFVSDTEPKNEHNRA